MVLPATYERTSQVMKTYYYQVAGFLLSVGLPADKDAEALLPSFRPFSVAGPEAGEAPLFDFESLVFKRLRLRADSDICISSHLNCVFEGFFAVHKITPV